MKDIIKSSSKAIKIPIFPLAIFLLPEGKVRLRIFEAKYLKMISIASNGQGFVIKLPKDSQQNSSATWGSLVKIEDFNQGEDGILEVDVKCLSLVKINDVSMNSDGLQFCNTKVFPHWSQQQYSQHQVAEHLADMLAGIMSEDTMLKHLYSRQLTQDPAWIVARWLELLPVSLAIKSSFVGNQDFSQAKNFVESIIHK